MILGISYDSCWFLNNSCVILMILILYDSLEWFSLILADSGAIIKLFLLILGDFYWFSVIFYCFSLILKGFSVFLKWFLVILKWFMMFLIILADSWALVVWFILILSDSPKVFCDSHSFSVIFLWFLMILSLEQFSLILGDYCWFLTILGDSQWFSLILSNCLMILSDSYWFMSNSWVDF